MTGSAGALSTSAMATTREESKFRIDAWIKPARAARVFGMDAEAASILEGVEAAGPWASARFYRCHRSETAALDVRTLAGEPIVFEQMLEGVDVVVMVATTDDGAAATAEIGLACMQRAIQTAGLVLDDDGTHPAVHALRPYARVLLLTRDPADINAILSALRA